MPTDLLDITSLRPASLLPSVELRSSFCFRCQLTYSTSPACAQQVYPRQWSYGLVSALDANLPTLCHQPAPRKSAASRSTSQKLDQSAGINTGVFAPGHLPPGSWSKTRTLARALAVLDLAIRAILQRGTWLHPSNRRLEAQW